MAKPNMPELDKLDFTLHFTYYTSLACSRGSTSCLRVDPFGGHNLLFMRHRFTQPACATDYI